MEHKKKREREAEGGGYPFVAALTLFTRAYNMMSTDFYKPAFVGFSKGGPTHEVKSLSIR